MNVPSDRLVELKLLIFRFLHLGLFIYKFGVRHKAGGIIQVMVYRGTSTITKSSCTQKLNPNKISGIRTFNATMSQLNSLDEEIFKMD